MNITDRVYFYKGREEEKLVRGVGSCNVVVLKGEQQVMVDTGLIVGGAFRDLLNAAKADGLDLTRARAVLHTHSHWDHITGDCIVQGEYGAKVYAHSWQEPYIESQKAAFRAFLLDVGEFYGEVFGLPAVFYKILLWYLGGSYSGLRVDEILKGGEELDFGLGVVACHTPGHSPGHMAYYIPEDKALIGGDLIDLETGEGADLNNPHSNYADGLASLEKVRALDIEYFLPAHGEPVHGKDKVESLLDRMIENTHRYIKDVQEFLSAREGTLTEMFNELMPNTPFTLKAMKMMQILTTLKHLQEMGEVALERKNGKLVWRLAPK
ncbi:MAG: MBL fold metallo-hydrolase [Candidatus Hydrogenedentota bacterium]|nr:MAG: MBL fold metallo-hydrolase [Candidatus Hydrogenedentota bacterium]